VNGLHPGDIVVEEIEHLSHLSLKLTIFRKMAESLILGGRRVAKLWTRSSRTTSGVFRMPSF
jgi:hypothetical protein